MSVNWGIFFSAMASLVVAAVPVAAQVCQAPPSGLVRYWPADGALTEVISGTATTAVGAVSFDTGVFGQAFAFGGGYLEGVPLGIVSGTVEFWANPVVECCDVRLFSQTSGATGQGGATAIGFANQPGTGWVWNGSTWTRVAGSVIRGRTWTHLAFVYQSGQAMLYVNGVYSGVAFSRFDFDASPFGIGAKFLNMHGTNFLGLMDEFSVYDRALTAEEISLLADRQRGTKCLIPTAHAGADQSVAEGGVVELTGSGTSSSPISGYSWRQIAGPPVVLDRLDIAMPRFTAAEVPRGGTTLTFQLVVTNTFGESEPDTVDITVTNVNLLPVAVARASAVRVSEGGTITLSGTDSYDGDNEPLAYEWVQIDGPPVVLDDPTHATQSFPAPLVGSAGATLRFQLSVSDGEAEALDTVAVAIDDVNHPPSANAGLDQTRAEGAAVSLDGSASADPDGDGLTFTWTQITGQAVGLANADSSTALFTAPSVGPGGVVLEFELTVMDSRGAASAPDVVAILVQNVNDAPACGAARPSVSSLWPPNHGLRFVSIAGVSDPNDDAITIRVTGVLQNEPINGLGDGDSSPDAVITAAGVLLRAERSGAGFGRVYEIAFEAVDTNGATCTGAVRIPVPRDAKSSSSPLVTTWYLSTSPQ